LRVSGRVLALFGRAPEPLADVALHDAAPGVLPLPIDLPAGARSLRIAADAEATRTIGRLELRLTVPARVPGIETDAAARAVTTAPARVWFLDDNAFVEPGGFWVRGASETTTVVDGRGKPVALALSAGPLPTVTTVTIGTSPPATVALAPGDTRVLAVPATSPIGVRIASSSGFHPHEHDQSSPDVRWLGVRAEFR
jgi:hypothetical protein